MAKKRSKARDDDPLAAYRRIRKPMPPPERIERDRRGELDNEDARRQIDDARSDRATDARPDRATDARPDRATDARPDRSRGATSDRTDDAP